MAALSDGDFTASSEVNDIIPTEHTQDVVEGFNLPYTIGRLFASAVPGRGYVSHRFARWDTATLPDPVRAGGETDTAPRIEFSTSSSTITPVLRVVQMVIPDEPIESQSVSPSQGIPMGALMNLVDLVEDYTDSALLTLAQGATTTIGSSATLPSLSNLRAVIHAYAALEARGTPAFVGNHYFWSLIQNELATSQAVFNVGVANNAMMTAGNVYHGSYLGVDMWESGNVATESGAANSFIMQVGGRHRVMGYVRQRALRVEFSRGDEMQSRQSNQWTLSWADGYGLLRQDEFIEAQFDAAA